MLETFQIEGKAGDFRLPGRRVPYEVGGGGGYVCVIHCVVIPFILDVRLVDAPAGVTQQEGHTGFLIHLPSVVLVFFFLIARRIQPSLSLVDRKVEFCVSTTQSFSTYAGGRIFLYSNTELYCTTNSINLYEHTLGKQKCYFAFRKSKETHGITIWTYRYV